jgi:hypothetical protein
VNEVMNFQVLAHGVSLFFQLRKSTYFNICVIQSADNEVEVFQFYVLFHLIY